MWFESVATVVIDDDDDDDDDDVCGGDDGDSDNGRRIMNFACPSFLAVEMSCT